MGNTLLIDHTSAGALTVLHCFDHICDDKPLSGPSSSTINCQGDLVGSEFHKDIKSISPPLIYST